MPKQKRQEIYDIYGKYSEVKGEGALYVNYRHKDDAYDFSGKMNLFNFLET